MAVLAGVRRAFRGYVAVVDSVRSRAGARAGPVWGAVAVGVALVIWGNGLVWVSRAADEAQDGHGEIVTLAGQFRLAVIVLALAPGVRRVLARWPHAPTRADRIVLAIAAAVVGLSVAAAVIRAGECEAPAGVAVTVTRLLVATAIGEEVLFRGWLLAVWARTRVRSEHVVLANGVFFGAWHVAGADNVAGVLVPAVLGTLLFVWGRARYGSLLAPALFHALTNMPGWVWQQCL